MKKYKIQILEDAKEDIIQIVNYIKKQLKEPEIAKQHSKAFKDAILKLKDSADIYNIIDEEIIGVTNIRKVNVKNFMIFYILSESEDLVQVIAVYYSRSDWQHKVKYR